MAGKIKQWIKNGRDVALVQSMMPAAVAVVFAIGEGDFSLILAALSIIGVAAAHLCANILDDYFDYKVDMTGDRDKVIRKGFRAMTFKYPYLTDGTETLATTWKAILNFAAVAGVCGLAIFVSRTIDNGLFGRCGSWWIPFLAGATAILAYFYSAPPLKLAYHGLGELEIGLIFGPMLMMGVYYSSCGVMDWSIVLVSIPVGILVLNILFTHSFIDMAGDEECGKMTFARLIGSQKTCLITSFAINFSPFVIVLFAVLRGILNPLYLLTFIALPRAIWLCRSLSEHYRGINNLPQLPPRWLGPMMVSRWGEIREAGIDWFLMRWMTARNILSAFCLGIIIAKILLLIF